jgi:hypothetical protein
MPKPIVDITTPPPDRRQAIELVLINTPQGVLIRSCGDLNASTPQAGVARTILRFADGLFEGGQPVRLDPEIVQAAL